MIVKRLLLVAAVLFPLSVHAQDDSCQYANDGECDEPRYAGTSDACRDGTNANDCSTADCSTALTHAEQEIAELDALLALLPDSVRESLGNNDCAYANDLECDDAAFNGTGGLCDEGTDLTDCRVMAAGGDNSCEYADDDECDEPGIGTGFCVSGSDANDCAAVAFMRNRSDRCRLALGLRRNTPIRCRQGRLRIERAPIPHPMGRHPRKTLPRPLRRRPGRHRAHRPQSPRQRRNSPLIQPPTRC